MNELAKKVTLLEGKKISLPIAQVKEVLRCLKQLCSEEPRQLNVLVRYLSDGKKRRR